MTEVSQGRLTPDKAYSKLKDLPFQDLEFARLDHHRELRSGIPEVVYCEGKSITQLQSIFKGMIQAKTDILATRLDKEQYKKLKKELPKNARYSEQARVLTLVKKKKAGVGKVVVVTAGTSDIPVAEEAVITAETFGSAVETLYDVGVAGLHRLLSQLDTLRASRVVIVVAGMDGALVSVIGGLIGQPVIGVPTSIGYGSSFEGVAPLLTMLNSCATGIGVVNIDNGFGAACLAHKINLLGES